MKIIIPLIILGIVLVSACTQVSDDVRQQAIDACIEKCQSNFVLPEWDWISAPGPCLANPLSELPDWVCDVAHSPRQDIDNLAENQCSAYREGRASHFVEVDINCNLIQAK